MFVHSPSEHGVPKQHWPLTRPATPCSPPPLSADVSVYNGWLVDRFGAALGLGCAGALIAVGYATLYHTVVASPPNKDWIAAFAFLVLGHGCVLAFLSSWTAAVALLPNPAWKGRVGGAVLAGFAGSAAVCAFIYHTGFHGDPAEYFQVLVVMALALAAKAAASLAIRTQCLCGRTPPPGIMPVSMGDQTREAEADPEQGRGAPAPLPAASTMDTLRTLARPGFLGMWLLVFLGLGSALMFVNTLGSVVDAMAGATGDAGPQAKDSSALTSTGVVTFAVCNVGFRLVGGTASDLLHARGHSRLWVQVVGCAIGIAAMAIFASTPPSLADCASGFICPAARTRLLLGSGLVGAGEGLIFTWPVVAHSWFDATGAGTAFTALNSAVGIGSVAFTAIASAVQAPHETSGTEPDGTEVRLCHGVHCFAGAYTAAAAAMALGAVVALLLIWRVDGGEAPSEVTWAHALSGTLPRGGHVEKYARLTGGGQGELGLSAVDGAEPAEPAESDSGRGGTGPSVAEGAQ